MKRGLWLLLAGSVLLLPQMSLGAAGGSPQPVITAVKGDVSAKISGAAWSKAAMGMNLSGGDSVKTGPGGKAEISIPSGAIRLFENSIIVIPALKEIEGKKHVAQVDMDTGSAVFRIKPEDAPAGFEVKTRHVIAGVKGSTMGIETDTDRTRVMCYFGHLLVTDPQRSEGSRTDLTTGRMMEVIGTSGFGKSQGFEPGDGWGGWYQDTKPRTEDPKPRYDNIRDKGDSGGRSYGAY